MTIFIVMATLKLVFIAFVITAIYKLVSALIVKSRYPESRYRCANAGIKILRERFAAGEIDEKEYKEKLKVMSE